MYKTVGHTEGLSQLARKWNDLIFRSKDPMQWQGEIGFKNFTIAS